MADYATPVDSKHSSCILFLIDQSGSMNDTIANGNGRRKADSVAEGINRCLVNFITRSTGNSGVKPYFDLAVIGYGASVGSAWAGSLKDRDWVKISEVAENPARLSESQPDKEGRTSRMPVWFEPEASGSTPMREALILAKQFLDKWFAAQKESRTSGLDFFPPIVVNITDGEPDGSPSAVVEMVDAIKTLKSDDGAVLVFNCHVTDLDAEAVKYPDSPAALPTAHARLLFDMSSVIPARLRNQAQKSVGELSDGARGMVFNADLAGLSDFIDMGTRVHELR